MTRDMWLPIGYTLINGLYSRALLYSGSDWQIYQTDRGTQALVVKPDLGLKWVKIGLVDKDLLHSLTFGTEEFYVLAFDNKSTIIPVIEAIPPNNKADAIAFAVSIAETRKIDKEDPLHDAIFIENISRLLPTWSLSNRVPDDIMFGTWLTGGVGISVLSLRRLNMLLGWLNPTDILDIVNAAGFNIPRGDIERLRREGINLSGIISNIESFPDNLGGNENRNLVNVHKKFILPGRPYLEEFFNEHVIDIIYNPERYETFGIYFPSAIVLYGPPGCGKTFAIEKLVEFIDWPMFSIDSSSVGSPYIHETSQKIADVFDKAISSSPAVVVIDEMEAFLSERGTLNTTGLHHVEEVGEFLRRIPEAINNRVLVIGMTNMIELIDPAILRKGRFDHVIEVGMPSHAEIKGLLESLLENIPQADDINITPLVDKLTNRPLSDTVFVIREAARYAAKSGKTCLDQETLMWSISNVQLNDSSVKGNTIGFIRR